MFCPECGKKNKEVALFCEFCGSKIQAEEIGRRSDSSTGIEKSFPAASAPGTGYQMPEMSYREQTNPQMAGALKKKTWSKGKKIIALELVILALAVFGFYKLGSEYYSLESTAVEYLRDVHGENYSSAYHRLRVGENPFLSLEMFHKVASEWSDPSAVGFKASQTESLGSDEYAVLVDITYESGDVYPYQIELVKEDKKAFLIFDQWKVEPTFLVYNYQVEVPYGTKVSLNGISLDSKYVSDENEYRTLYVIPEIFNGAYDVSVTMDPFESYETLTETDQGYFYLEEMNLAESLQDELMTKAGLLLQETYKAAAEGKRFKEIETLYKVPSVDRGSILSDLESEYNGLVDSFQYGDFSSAALMEFRYLKAFTEYHVVDGVLQAEVEVEYEGNYEDQLIYGGYRGSFYGNTYYYFEYQNGEWMMKGHRLDASL